MNLPAKWAIFSPHCFRTRLRWEYVGRGVAIADRVAKAVFLLFNDILCIFHPKNTRAISKTLAKIEVSRMSGSSVMCETDRQSDTHTHTSTDVPCIIDRYHTYLSEII